MSELHAGLVAPCVGPSITVPQLQPTAALHVVHHLATPCYTRVTVNLQQLISCLQLFNYYWQDTMLYAVVVLECTLSQPCLTNLAMPICAGCSEQHASFYCLRRPNPSMQILRLLSCCPGWWAIVGMHFCYTWIRNRTPHPVTQTATERHECKNRCASGDTISNYATTRQKQHPLLELVNKPYKTRRRTQDCRDLPARTRSDTAPTLPARQQLSRGRGHLLQQNDHVNSNVKRGKTQENTPIKGPCH